MTNADPGMGRRISPCRDLIARRSGTRAVLPWLAVLAVGGALLLAVPALGQEATELPTAPGAEQGGDLPTTAASEQTTTDQAAIGPDLYQRNCASCHGNRGEGSFRGPTLIGVGAASADYWLRSGRMPLDEPGQEAKRSEPVFTDAQIRELVDYVASLGEGPEIPEVDLGAVDLAAGGELYRLNCASCHNWDGKGGALVNRGNAPPLHPVPNRQLAEAIRVGPGAMPQFSSRQLDEEDLNDVVAYVDYLRTPQDAGGYGLAHWGPSTETVAAFVAMIVLVLITAWLGERRGRG